ncbi:ubiquitin carboxyl-terminal hydrolase 14-like isoform X1 [Varroa jacobsoni]|uniref:ubiquitin carboxyl-terminal hydrolase 14-like isoform X1 n=2 Tax=Varroa jacobsoni TaxID=62625 RepID=UPI000BF7D478|nr:ubiquitin carboxyl-terminal hydrolase 14-like isoform X1 [Varroa jacobsoni]
MGDSKDSEFLTMDSMKVKVKWGKEVYDVEVHLKEDPEVFRAQLFALTGVLPERQKVMFKGAILKDSWGSMKLKDGATILMMGTKEELPQAPTEKTVFMEDMDDSEISTALKLPTGLNNLGNTCYMNAVVQCFKTVPELTDQLAKFTGEVSLAHPSAKTITGALRDLYRSMEGSYSTAPIVLLQALHTMFPRFAEKGEHGANMQQDANECWTEMMRMLQQQLPPVNNVGLAITGEDQTASPSAAAPAHKNLIDQLFGGKLNVALQCTESEEELTTQSTEDFLQLSCFISNEVKYLIAGLKLRMQETITKMSPTLNRDASYQKTSKISRLPAYLTINLVRFYYKERESVNAKILKNVVFPMMLDVYELCSTDLQQKLSPQREKFKKWDNEQVEKKVQGAGENGSNKGPEDEAAKKIIEPFSFSEDPGSNNSGFYQLQAVLTHKGRSSSSGHYVGWVRRQSKEWFKCDDDVVSLVSEEEILKLSGGGDWHVAYVLLYGPRVLG